MEKGESLEHSLPELDPWPGVGKGEKLGGSGVGKAQSQGYVQIGTLSRAQLDIPPSHLLIRLVGGGGGSLSDLLKFTEMSPRAQWGGANTKRAVGHCKSKHNLPASPLSQLGRVDHSGQPQQDSLNVGGVTG